jgi:hypothetical protein
MTSSSPARGPEAGRVFGFTTAHRRAFVLTYVLSKTLFFWREVHWPRCRLFVYEVVYSLCRATHRPPLALRWLQLERVSTVFGVFTIRPGTIDAACVSPAVERPDLDHLLSRLRELLAAGRSVLFLDRRCGCRDLCRLGPPQPAGARRDPCHRFRTVPIFLRVSPTESARQRSGTLVTSRQLALGDGSITSALLRVDPREPGGSVLTSAPQWGTESEQVRVSTIDVELAALPVPDVLVLKLDVEGAEITVLEGAKATLAVLLLVEDFVDDSIVGYLEKSGWSFETKLTPYNSFWSMVAPR